MTFSKRAGMHDALFCFFCFESQGNHRRKRAKKKKNLKTILQFQVNTFTVVITAEQHFCLYLSLRPIYLWDCNKAVLAEIPRREEKKNDQSRQKWTVNISEAQIQQ